MKMKQGNTTTDTIANRKEKQMGKKRTDCIYEYGEVWTPRGEIAQDVDVYLYLEAGDTTQSISEQRREKFIEALEIIHCYNHSLEILEVNWVGHSQVWRGGDWQIVMRAINMEVPKENHDR